MYGPPKIPLHFLLCLLPLFAKGQPAFDKPFKLTEENGLPTNAVRQVRLDDNGFVWIATTEGLCRFDGQGTKVYRHDPKDSFSLSDPLVNAIISYRSEIWVGTPKAISVLDTKTQKFRHYQLGKKGKSHSFIADQNLGGLFFYKDRQEDLWIGTRANGVWLYDKAADDFHSFSPPITLPGISPLLGTYLNILSIEGHISNDSIIWAGTPGGLLEINKFTGNVNTFTFPQKNTDYQVAVNAMRRLYHHDDGLLYAGSWNAGVHVFDPVSKKLEPLPVNDEPGNEILKDAVHTIVRKSSTEFWITTTAGVVLYNSQQKKISSFKQNNPSKEGFYGVECIDKFNRVWLSTIQGVHYFNPSTLQFSTYAFEHLYGQKWGYAFYILPDEKGEVLTVCLRQANGLYEFNKTTQTWLKLNFSNWGSLKLERLVVRGFQKINPGEYLLSADEGLFIYKKNIQKLERLADPPKIKYSRWGDILLDRSGNLWICANTEGLIRRNLKTGRDKIFYNELRGPSDSLPVQPTNLFKDSRENIWFSFTGGFGVYVANKDSIFRFITGNDSYAAPEINGFAEDKDHKVWMHTRSGWLAYASANEPGKGITRKIYLSEKNIYEPVFDLAADGQGNIWGYTSKHLFKIREDHPAWEQFSFKYGLTRPDFYHFSFMPSGEMLFGGRNSITLATPSALSHNPEIPVPYIDRVELQHHAAGLSPYRQSDSLTLGHRQNFFNIHYSAIAFNLPEQVQFRYRLQGFEEWKDSRGKGSANYTNVPSGSYVFQLQAANNEGIWNDKMLELHISIATPFWQAWWFRIGVVAFLLFFIHFAYRYRIAEVKKKEQLRSQYEKKLANVEMSALLAQMNPHFLFNSLNSIDSYIIKHETAKASEYLNNFARLMRLILQHSRSNYISLKDELEALELYLQMEALRLGNRFNYSLVLNPGLDPSTVLLPPMLLQPYVENAIWHGLIHKKSQEPGKLKIAITRQDSNLNCIIEDNGIGREMALALNKQKWGNLKPSMGTQITRDRIEIINKLYNTNTRIEIIDLKDPEGKPAGTRVELIIPV